MEKVRSGTFVDFKDFLADNVILLQRIQELGQAGAIPAAAQPLLSNSRLREVVDPLTWASCFLAFMAVKTDQEETRQMAAYGMIILQIVRKHNGNGWLLYDKQFRLQQAAGASLSWTDINASLLAATVLGQTGEKPSRSCQLCLASDHSREECALASLEPHKGSQTTPTHSRLPPPRHIRRPMPYRGPGFCYRFNNGNCTNASCRFEHACSFCSSPSHPEVSCSESRMSRPRGRQSDSKMGPSQVKQSVAGDRPRQ